MGAAADDGRDHGFAVLVELAPVDSQQLFFYCPKVRDVNVEVGGVGAVSKEPFRT